MSTKSRQWIYGGRIMGAKTAPLVVEAESAYRDLDATSASGKHM